MTDPEHTFTPAWRSPPGDTIADIIDAWCWTRADLARRMGCTVIEVDRLIAGELPITPAIAASLERALGTTATFWLAREQHYREEQKS